MIPSLFIFLLGLAAGPSPAPAPSPVAGAGPVILFLVDNSASLPPLDPQEKRVEALEKVFTFLRGHPYRLVLFGGRDEISIDDVSRYSSTGLWTDFAAALRTAHGLMSAYPKGTEFRVIMLTDGLLDPNPRDWSGLPAGTDLKAYVHDRTLEEVKALEAPLYVILVGDLPPQGTIAPGDPEQSPPIVLDMVRAANGSLASPRAQKLAAFLSDDGALLKKFIYRVEPHEGLRKILPVVKRITAPAGARVEVQVATILVVPLVLFVFLLIGILVGSFPAPGDAEVIDLAEGQPVHVAVDRMHKLESGGWGGTGLSLVADAKEAAATFVYQRPGLDLSGAGLDTEPLDALGQRLLLLPLDEMRRVLGEMGEQGTKDEKIYALNLNYVAQRMNPSEAERSLAAPPAERRRLSALDFLRAKAHLMGNPELRRKLVDARVQMTGYGKDADRKDELAPGTRLRVGPYGLVVRDVSRGGRKDVRLVLLYERVPSLLGVKNWMPAPVQRAARFRRSSQRLVN